MLGDSQRMHIGFFGCVALQIGNIVGTGIYSSPTSIIDSTGSIGLSLCVWIIVGLISTTGGLVYAEVASLIGRSGGDAAYVQFIDWQAITFTFAIGQCVIIYPIVMCMQALAFTRFLSFAFTWTVNGETASFYVDFGIATTLILILLAANLWFRADWLMYFNILMAMVKIGFLLFVVIAGFVIGDFSRLSNIFQGSSLNPDQFLAASYGAVFSFEGYDLAALSVEEVRNPKRNLPLATCFTMVIIICIYVLVNLSYALLLGREEMLYLESFETIQKVINLIFGRANQWIMPLIIAICLINSMNCTFLGTSRITHAMGRVKVFPSCLSCWQDRIGSPRAAYVYTAMISIILLLFLDADKISLMNQLSVTFQWFQRVVTALILLYIRVARLSTDNKVYRANILFPCLYLVCMFALILGTVWMDWTRGVILMGALVTLVPFYYVFRSQKGLRRFEGYEKVCSVLDDKTSKAAQILFRSNIETLEMKNKK